MSYELRVMSGECPACQPLPPIPDPLFFILNSSFFILHFYVYYPKITWTSIVKAIIQAAIAALTALGVTSCSPLISFLS